MKRDQLFLAYSERYSRWKKHFNTFYQTLLDKEVPVVVLDFRDSPKVTPWIQDWFYTLLLPHKKTVVRCSFLNSYEFPSVVEEIDSHKKWFEELFRSFGYSVVKAPDIFLDGGSVIQGFHNGGLLLFISDVFHGRNSHLPYPERMRILRRLFGGDEVHIIFTPTFVLEKTGHIDSLIRVIGNKVFTVYNPLWRSFYKSLFELSEKLGLFIYMLPIHFETYQKGFEYLGFIDINKKLFLPTYGVKNLDSQILSYFEKVLPDWEIYPLPSKVCNVLSVYNATPHCVVSSLVNVDNPVSGWYHPSCSGPSSQEVYMDSQKG